MKQFFMMMGAIVTTGAVLYGARKVPVVKEIAEIVTKGYGE